MALLPLLGSALPLERIAPDVIPAFERLQAMLDAEIAPLAAAHDAAGRYPTAAVAALKRSGFLRAVLPAMRGGLGLSRRASLEAQVRIAIADSALAQIYKVHDELLREIPTYAPEATTARLAAAVAGGGTIVGIAVAEPGRRVDDPFRTLALPRAEGGFTVSGTKIYTTGAAEADFVATWAFNPEAPGVATNPLGGLQLNLIPRGTPGMEVRGDWDALGQRATDSGTIVFRDVATDPAWNATIPGRFSPPHASLGYLAGFAAILVGIGLSALRDAVPFVGAQSRPWPSAAVDSAADDPYVRRLMGELTADLAAVYAMTLSVGDLLDAFERGEIDRTAVAIPVYAVAGRAALRATSEIFTLMGTRAVSRLNGFDRHWRNARTLSLHDPVEWKHAEIGRHVLSGWEPPPGLYQ